MSRSAPSPSKPMTASGARASGVIAVLAFGGVVVSVTQTLMVPVLGELPSLLRTSSANAAWVITITLLTGAVSTPVLGRLGDMFGKRRTLLIALGLLVAGSLVSGVASSLLPMMIGRALQGCSIGAIPLGISIMRDELPPERLGSAMGLMSSSLGIGGALGLPASALVAQNLDWHILFFGGAGLGAIGLVLILLVVPESAVRSPGRFDVRGAIGLSAGLVCLLLVISQGSDWGWGSGRALGCFAAALVIFVSWGVMELRTAEPLVDLRTTAQPQVLLTNLASVLLGFALYCTQLVPPQLLQLPTSTGYGLGQSMLMAGLCVAPTGLLMMAVSPLSARLTKGFGPKTTLICGIAVLGVAYLAGLALLSKPWQLALFSAIAGAGVGLAYAAMPTLIINAVPESETAAANGLNALMRSIGTSTSSAVVGMVLSHMTTRVGPVQAPAMAGFRMALLIACGACVFALLIAAGIPGRRGARATASPGAALRGRVRDGQGAPVKGASLSLIDRAGHQIARTVSLPDGSYAIDTGESGDFVLICFATGHQPQAATVNTSTGPVELDVELTGDDPARAAVRAPAPAPPAHRKVALIERAGNTGNIKNIGNIGNTVEYRRHGHHSSGR
jgi:MFS family permease